MARTSSRYSNGSTHRPDHLHNPGEELDFEDIGEDGYPLTSLKSGGEDTDAMRSDTAFPAKDTKPVSDDDVSEDEDDVSVQSFELYTPDEEKQVLKKLDTKLVLFVALLYMLSFLDRSSRSS